MDRRGTRGALCRAPMTWKRGGDLNAAGNIRGGGVLRKRDWGEIEMQRV